VTTSNFGELQVSHQ